MKVLINGCNGKMGQEVAKEIKLEIGRASCRERV